MFDVIVKLLVGDIIFETGRKTLLKYEHTYFHDLLSTGAFQPDNNGAYFIDIPAMGFGRILDYLNSGKLSVEGLSHLEEECMYSSLKYLLIPHQRQWHYDEKSLIEGFIASYVFELNDSRLCGVRDNTIIAWNLDNSIIELVLTKQTALIRQIIQLFDNRICIRYYEDNTMKLWSIESSLCVLTLIGHDDNITCMMQLHDGRLCSASSFYSSTVKVWNTFTGICEISMKTLEIKSLMQLSDGRIVGGGGDGHNIYIFNLVTGTCEVNWEIRPGLIGAIASINSSVIFTGSYDDNTIKAWNTATGESIGNLVENSGQTAAAVTVMIIMQDGKLCTASSVDGSVKIWNVESGECEKMLILSTTEDGVIHHVLQLRDGRLVIVTNHEDSQAVRGVWIWS